MAITELKPVTFDELLAAMSEESHDAIRSRITEQGATHVALFECLDMCSSNLGHRTVVMVGPNNTFKTVDHVRNARLGDVPSRFQYPVQFAPVPGHRHLEIARDIRTDVRDWIDNHGAPEIAQRIVLQGSSSVVYAIILSEENLRLANEVAYLVTLAVAKELS